MIKSVLQGRVACAIFFHERCSNSKLVFSHVNSCFCFLSTTVVVLCARVESDASNKSSRIIPVRGFALILDSNKSVNLIKVSRAHNLFLAW